VIFFMRKYGSLLSMQRCLTLDSRKTVLLEVI
jgi:hypothetical protein